MQVNLSTKGNERKIGKNRNILEEAGSEGPGGEAGIVISGQTEEGLKNRVNTLDFALRAMGKD